MKKRHVWALLGLLLAIPGAAQDGLAIRIETSHEGLHRIPGAALKPHASLDRIPADRLVLTHNGQPVPIEIFGASDGRFDPSDEIIFFAERPTERHAKTETYVLSDRGRPARLRQGSVSGGGRDTATATKLVVRAGRSLVFDPLATVRQDVIRGPARSPWFTAVLAPPGVGRGNDAQPNAAAIGVILDPMPLRELPARLRIDLFGAVVDGIPQKLGINVNGTELPPQTWTSALSHVIEVTIPPNVLRRETSVRLTNLSDHAAYSETGNEIASRRRNDLLISDLSITYDAPLEGPTVSGQQIVLRLAAEAGAREGMRRIRIESRQREGYITVDPAAGRIWRTPVVEVAADREVTLAVCSLGGAYLPEPDAIRAMRPTREHLTGQGGDYVIVTTTDLRPAVSILADHRRAEGLTPVVVEARELYDAFTHGAFDPDAIQRFLVAANVNWPKKPRYLLIVGDADADVNWINKRETIPAHLVMTDYNGFTATDALHGDLDGNGLPDIAVGRIPTRTREDFLSVAHRIIAMETNPPSGAWRRRAAFFAGEGRFGPAIDRVLESQAADVISKIPAEFDVQMTYGNPTSSWYWPAEDFNGHLIRSFNEGALVFTYIGHGSPEAFDYVYVGTQRHPILGIKDIEQLQCGGRAPVMAIIACSTGRYDDPNRDCLAEKMLLKEGGPIAVIAASRISHPYANALLGKGICEPFFDAQNRVGEAFRAGVAKMLDSSKDLMYRGLAATFLSKAVDSQKLVRDHVYIYNLLGDPAQRIAFPARLSIEAPEVAKVGASVEVKATLPEGTSADAMVTLCAPRNRRANAKAESEPTPAGASDTMDAIRSRHAAANNHVLVRAPCRVEGGALAATLHFPGEVSPGVYWIVCSIDGNPDAVGARRIRVEE